VVWANPEVETFRSLNEEKKKDMLCIGFLKDLALALFGNIPASAQGRD
jgi:hypothetical protein